MYVSGIIQSLSRASSAAISSKNAKPTANDAKQKLEEDCKSLTCQTENLKKCGYLSRENVIETKPISPVSVIEHKSDKSRKIAYIGSANWSSAVLVPKSSDIEAFTDGNGPCPVLAMDLINEQEGPYIFLSHVYCEGIDSQIDSFVSSLTQRRLHANEVIFSPSTGSNFSTSKEVLNRFSNGNLNAIVRSGQGSALVSNLGWAIQEQESPDKFYSSIWQNGEVSYESQINWGNIIVLPSSDLYLDLSQIHPTNALKIFSNDFSFVLVMGDKGVEVWDTKKKEYITTLSKKANPHHSFNAVLSPDDSLALISTGYQSWPLELWDIKQSTKLRDIYYPTRFSQYYGLIAIFPDNSKILAIKYRSIPYIPIILDIESGKEILEFKEGLTHSPSSIAISKSGNLAAIGDTSGKIAVFNTKDGEKLASFTTGYGYPTALSFNNDGSKLFTLLSFSELAKVWDLKTLEEKSYLYLNPSRSNATIIQARFIDENHVFLAYGNGIVILNKLAMG